MEGDGWFAWWVQRMRTEIRSPLKGGDGYPCRSRNREYPPVARDRIFHSMIRKVIITILERGALLPC